MQSPYLQRYALDMLDDAASSKLISTFAGLGPRIGIFGGSFNPIHNAHLELATLAKNKLNLDVLVFIPTKQNPLKPDVVLASDKDRIEMLSRALSANPDFLISDIECRSASELSYSVETLRKIIKETDPSVKLFLIVGGDQVAQFHLWKDYKEILSMAEIVLVNRHGIGTLDLSNLNPHLDPQDLAALKQNFIEFNSPTSATTLRGLMGRGQLKEASEFLPAPVFEWIIQNGLYGTLIAATS